MATKNRQSWHSVSGTDIIEALDDNTLESLVPRESGIYIWQRVIAAPSVVLNNAESFKKWLENVVAHPSARLGRRSMWHCVWSEGIQIGGGDLSSAKNQVLNKVMTSHKLRPMLARFTESLSPYTMPIYVGEAKDLNFRTKQHIAGKTRLEQYIKDFLELSWQDLALHYYVLSGSTEPTDQVQEIQQLFEIIAQRILAPFGTHRPG